MKKAILIFILSTIFYSGYSQDTLTKNSQLLKYASNMHSDVKTIYLNINYLSVGESNAYNMLDILDRKKFIKKTQYKSSIQFNIIGDTIQYYLPLKKLYGEINRQLINPQNENAIAVIKIKAFKNHLYNYGKLFFIIETIEFIK